MQDVLNQTHVKHSQHIVVFDSYESFFLHALKFLFKLSDLNPVIVLVLYVKQVST